MRSVKAPTEEDTSYRGLKKLMGNTENNGFYVSFKRKIMFCSRSGQASCITNRRCHFSIGGDVANNDSGLAITIQSPAANPMEEGIEARFELHELIFQRIGSGIKTGSSRLENRSVSHDQFNWLLG